MAHRVDQFGIAYSFEHTEQGPAVRRNPLMSFAADVNSTPTVSTSANKASNAFTSNEVNNPSEFNREQYTIALNFIDKASKEAISRIVEQMMKKEATHSPK